MRFVFILCSLFSLEAFGKGVLDSVRAEQRTEGLFVIHEVEEQETLYSIAKRYGGSVDSIVQHNEIEDNRIEIGQYLSVLIEAEPVDEVVNLPDQKHHVVKEGETLYSISKLYEVKLKSLKKLNELNQNEISPGQILLLPEDAGDTEAPLEEVTVAAILIDSAQEATPAFPEEDFQKYLVQTGETLASIAQDFDVPVESLREWNGLSSDFIRIGQELRIRKEPMEAPEMEADSLSLETRLSEEGFERVFQQGIAAPIEDIRTTKFLALHRNLPIGTEVAVRNLMNNLVVHVKVVGQLPDTGLNRGLTIRLSSPAYDQLGILDPRSRVELSYDKE